VRKRPWIFAEIIGLAHLLLAQDFPPGSAWEVTNTDEQTIGTAVVGCPQAFHHGLASRDSGLRPDRELARPRPQRS